MVTAKKRYKYDPDYAIPPGDSLKDLIESLGMSQAELSRRTELTVQTISRILKGNQPISYDTANRLERVTGVRASTWNNLESNYQELLQKIADRDQFASESAWIKSIPTTELIKRGFLTNTKDKIQLIRETLTFYGVNSVNAWTKIWTSPSVAPRRSLAFETKIGSASAWIRQAEIQALKYECRAFDRDKFKQALTQIRALTKESPELFGREIVRLCANSGVAVVYVNNMPKVPWCGATKWLSPEKAMIVLSLRGKKEDIFWFTFFHEAYHVLNPIKKDLLVNDGNLDDPEEVKANKYSAEFLLPSKYNGKIISGPSINNFFKIANENNISIGIIIGRYHYLTGNFKRYNNNIRKIAIG